MRGRGNWSDNGRAFLAVDRQRELQDLRQEIRQARQARQSTSLRRRLGRLLITAGCALYGPPQDDRATEVTLAGAHKR